MKLDPESRAILRQYKSLINDNRKTFGLPPMSTDRVIEEVFGFVAGQNTIYLGGALIRQPGKGSRYVMR